MKIIIISAAYPLRGGIAQHTGILYNKLTERGHQVSVFTFKRQYPKIFFPGKTQLDNSADEAVRIPTRRILDSIGPLSWFKVFRIIKKYKPDLLIFKYWMPFFAPCFGTITRLTKLFTDIKILYLCENIVPHERRFGDLALTKYAFGKVDYFIVQSEVVRKQLLQVLPEALHKLVPHPVYEVVGEALEKSEAKRRLGIKEKNVILFFGIVRAYKGLDYLLVAMPQILARVKVKLLVVGEFYEPEAKFRSMIEALDLNGSVEITSDFVPNEDVSLYFSAADVVVLPYKSATQSGIVQIAYHLDKPCIVTDVGGLAEVVIDGKTGFVVKPNDAEHLAEAVIRFYLEEREQEFVENVRHEKKKYSWENMIAATEGFLYPAEV
jgi:glycosyltransferase involved in cell wall biosynthesis